jgi:hypothetical protein
MVSTSKQDNGVVKADYHINDHHALTGTYFHGIGGGTWHDQAWEVGIPGSDNSPWLSQLWGYIQTGSGAWTWTPTSTLVNEFRVGYSHYSQPSVSNDSTVNPLAYGINTGVTDKREFGFPFIQINSLNGATFKLGGNWPKYNGPDGSLQILEHISILRGKHAIKFGGEIIRDTSDPFVTMNAKGLIKFGSIEDFLTGTVKPAGSLIQAGDPQRYLHDYSYAAFIQDDWRIIPKLMLNLGVRYELPTVLKDRNNQLGNFDLNSTTGMVQVGIGGLTAPYHGDHNNFSPRVGFAWDINGNGKTVLRGGGSIMYEEIPIITMTAVGNQLGLNQIPTGAQLIYCSTNPCANGSTQITKAGIGNMGALNVGVGGGAMSTAWQAQTAACVNGTTPTACGSIFPQSIFQLSCGDGQGPPNGAFTDPVPCNIEAVDMNLRTPYISTWTLTLQRAITNNLSLEVAYVGNHGTKLLGFQDINQPPPGSSFAAGEVAWCNANIADPTGATTPYACDPGDSGGAGAVQSFRPYFSKFPYIGEIDRLSNQDASNYNALEVTLTQRPTHGLSFLAGYTYSHAFDTGSNNFNDIQLPPDSSHPTRGVYGQSLFDVRHRFTLTTTYAIPGIKHLGQLLQGWEINSVLTLQSASPWGVQDFSNDFSGTNQVNELDTFGQTWNFYGNDADFQAGRAVPIPCWSGSGASAIAGCTIASTARTPSNPYGAPAACVSAAAGSIGELNTIDSVGCYVSANGKSVLIPPALGTVGNARRNIFPDLGFKDWDLSLLKETKIKERLTAEFRAEFFNVLNHANFSDPNGPANAGFNDPSTGFTGNFGCGCNTPDQAAPNPVLGTGGARSIQLGLKLIF